MTPLSHIIIVEDISCEWSSLAAAVTCMGSQFYPTLLRVQKASAGAEHLLPACSEWAPKGTEVLRDVYVWMNHLLRITGNSVCAFEGGREDAVPLKDQQHQLGEAGQSGWEGNYVQHSTKV